MAACVLVLAGGAGAVTARAEAASLVAGQASRTDTIPAGRGPGEVSAGAVATLPAASTAPVVRWEPQSPTDASALAVTIVPSASGRESADVTGELADVTGDLADVTGDLGGRPLRFGRLGDGWFALAPLPADETGPVELVVSWLGADSATMQRWTVHVRPRAYSETELRVAPRFTSPPADVLARIERERDLVRSTLREVSPEWLIDGNFVRPRNTRITSPFGQKRVFNGELQSRHWGVDLAGDVGAPVRVAGRGRVAIARNLYYAGNAVYVDHGLGVFSGYYHLSQIDVSEGDVVERGQVIGRVGATGRVTGPHLHWSFFVSAERLDASSLLELRVPEAPEPEEPVFLDPEPQP